MRNSRARSPNQPASMAARASSHEGDDLPDALAAKKALGEEELRHVLRDLVPLAALARADVGEDFDENRACAGRVGVEPDRVELRGRGRESHAELSRESRADLRLDAGLFMARGRMPALLAHGVAPPLPAAIVRSSSTRPAPRRKSAARSSAILQPSFPPRSRSRMNRSRRSRSPWWKAAPST